VLWQPKVARWGSGTPLPPRVLPLPETQRRLVTCSVQSFSCFHCVWLGQLAEESEANMQWNQAFTAAFAAPTVQAAWNSSLGVCASACARCGNPMPRRRRCCGNHSTGAYPLHHHHHHHHHLASPPVLTVVIPHDVTPPALFCHSAGGCFPSPPLPSPRPLPPPCTNQAWSRRTSTHRRAPTRRTTRTQAARRGRSPERWNAAPSGYPTTTTSHRTSRQAAWY
jgi:hypothetical protein